MPHHKSAKKRVRQTETRTARNRARVSKTRTIIKKLKTAIEGKDKEGASKLLVSAQSLLGRLAKTGVIKGNNAARKTSRLAQQVKRI